MNKGRYFQNWKKTVLTITNILVLAIAFAIVSFLLLDLFMVANPFQCGLGLWVSGVAIHEDSVSKSWTCANTA